MADIRVVSKIAPQLVSLRGGGRALSLFSQRGQCWSQSRGPFFCLP